jgi:hypothetical protein
MPRPRIHGRPIHGRGMPRPYTIITIACMGDPAGRPYNMWQFAGFSRSIAHFTGLFPMYSRIAANSRSLRITRS